jgi:cobalt-zinc-cadmium efflux system outer membrane protein
MIPRTFHYVTLPSSIRRSGRLTCGIILLLVTTPKTLLAQELFTDSSKVRQLKESVVVSSPEIAARRAALDAAAARVRAAGFGPPAALSAEIEEVGGANIANAGSMRLDISREFVSGGLRAAQRHLAERDVDRAKAELDFAERSLRVQVDRALTLAVGSVAIARRLAAEDSLLSAAEEGVRSRFAVGDARYVDVLRLRTERLRVQTDAASAFTEARIGRETLIVLVSRADGAGSLDTLVDTLIARELQDPLGVPLPVAPSVDSLISVSAAAQLGAIALSRTQAARQLTSAAQRPTIVASLGVQRFAADNRGYKGGPTLGATVSLPFTARTANRASLVAADREIAVAETQRAAALLTLRATLTSAYQRYETARERLTLFDAALLRGAREERESALSAYRAGELSLVELLDFERALARAEIARLRSRMDAVDALADLISAAAGDSNTTHSEFILPPEESQ